MASHVPSMDQFDEAAYIVPNERLLEEINEEFIRACKNSTSPPFNGIGLLLQNQIDAADHLYCKEVLFVERKKQTTKQGEVGMTPR